MKRNTILVAFAAALFLVGSVWAAGPKQASNKAETAKISGTLVSSGSSEMVVSTNVRGDL